MIKIPAFTDERGTFSAYAGLGWRRGDLPIAERLADTVLSLPMGPHLNANGVRPVIDAIAAAEKSID